MSNYLLATQKDCKLLADASIAYEEHRMATADYAVSAGCVRVSDDGSKLVARKDLIVQEFISPSSGLSMRIECGVKPLTVLGDNWQYIEMWLRNPEVQGDVQRDTNGGDSHDLVLTKISGGNVGDVSITSYPHTFLHNISVTTPANVSEMITAHYNLSNTNGDSLTDFRIDLEPTIEDFPITLYIDTINETSVVGASVTLGDMYAGTEYILLPNSYDEHQITISSKDLWYHAGGNMGLPINFINYDTHSHWETDEPDIYSLLDPSPDGKKSENSRLRFFNWQAAANMYQEYVAAGEVSIWIQVYLKEN